MNKTLIIDLYIKSCCQNIPFFCEVFLCLYTEHSEAASISCAKAVIENLFSPKLLIFSVIVSFVK